MDFEWEKLINGESDIDADDINALANGIIKNEKEIKAIKKIMDNGGTIPEYLTEYFKILPEDADIDALVEEGKYIVNKRIDVADYIETITVRWGVNNYEDFDSEYQTIYQVKECFDSNGYQMLIRDRVSDYQWSEWQDCFGTDGGGATFFESATPQIDITLEEDTTSLDITTLGGKPLSEFNYTTAKILIENAVLPEKGANGGLNLYINSDYSSRYRVTIPGFPTTFLTNNTKQYWSGYCNIVEGIIFGLASATGNVAWGANMQTLADSSPLHEYKKVERVYLLSATASVPMPIGTKIKIWLK